LENRRHWLLAFEMIRSIPFNLCKHQFHALHPSLLCSFPLIQLIEHPLGLIIIGDFLDGEELL
jgi:hypothetical protein